MICLLDLIVSCGLLEEACGVRWRGGDDGYEEFEGGRMDGDENVLYFFDLLPLFLWTAHPLSRPFR